MRSAASNDELSRRDLLGRGAAAAASAATSPLLAGSGDSADRPNILFISVDDLRPQLNCYGREQMVTPHMDRLADRGVVFERAYCQAPVCGASRCSLLSGCRPDTTGIHGYRGKISEAMPDVLTMPQHFRNHGYRTVSLGKVYHSADDDPEGWSREPWMPKNFFPGYVSERAKHIRANNDVRGPAFEAPEVPDEAYPDGRTARRAVREMERLAGDRFFLGVGFVRPHLPFNAPRRYWDLYGAGDIRMPDYMKKPKGAPNRAMHNSGELRQYYGIPSRGELSDKLARKLINGYYASVSFLDAQVGKLLAALEKLNLAENTIVILWGDHGWNLREHGLWCKHSCFETSLWSPLLLAGPRVPGGKKTAELAEFVDVYPTLADLCGLPVPEHVEGVSLRPLLENDVSVSKRAAFSEFKDARSVKTDRYRYTRWLDGNGRRQAHMLYDHKTNQAETVNLANNEEYSDTVKRLSRLLDKRGEVEMQVG